MKKPYIICHMMMSIDGRIDCGMTVKIAGSNEYYETLNALNVPTTLIGRVTAQLEMSDSGVFEPTNAAAAFGKEGFSKKRDAAGYQVVVDTKGTLLWRDDSNSGTPLVVILSEAVTTEYLAYLDSLHISRSSAAKRESTCAELRKSCTLSLAWNAWRSLAAARSMQPSSMRDCWMRSAFCSAPESMDEKA